jgi:DNA-binding CsgD family transcriptional regulator
VLRQALAAFRCGDEGMRWSWLVSLAAAQLWDDESWDVLSARDAELVRGAGALAVLPLTLSARAGLLRFTGELAAAAALVAEAEAVSAATGCRPAACRLVKDLARHERAADGADLVGWPRALLCNSIGRYEEALVAAERAREQAPAPPFATWALVEEVEAAARSGSPDRARVALERLAQTTQASGSDWALGIEARSRALVSDGDDAERLYREAVERLARTRVRTELARTHLLYGEWLRREQRRCDAREQLRRARELFSDIGADAFAARAARELVATGETARKRTIETRDQLTAREAQIAELARDGLSNAEIGARMYISPRTVEYHLTKIFAKLNLTSRVQLENALPAHAAAGLLAAA